jgi:hypothetical protein
MRVPLFCGRASPHRYLRLIREFGAIGPLVNERQAGRSPLVFLADWPLIYVSFLSTVNLAVESLAVANLATASFLAVAGLFRSPDFAGSL